MAKLLKKAKTAEPIKTAVATAVETQKDEDLFDPLPSVVPASGNAFPKKRYINLDGKKFRVFRHTLHKGEAGREKTIDFINAWDPAVSVRITNPTVRQIQELQSLYTRNRGFNLMKFNNSYTLYRMRVLTEDEISNIEEED